MKYLMFFILLFTFCFAEVFVDNSINELFEENENVNVIVMFKQEDSKTMRISSDSREMGMKIQNVISKTSIENEKIRELNLINGFSTEITKDDLNELKNNPNIEGIYYNYPVTLFLNESVPLIRANDVWPMQYNGKNITGQGQTVCVIDTGVDYTHPDLVDNVIGGWNSIEENYNYFDDHSHGTHCAGIIASTHPIYRGVAPSTKIVAVKALNDTHGTMATIISAINWCLDNKDNHDISVISMSLGMKYYLSSSFCDDEFPAMRDAINNVVAQNISVVVATGNDNSSIGISSPACIENSIRVTATTKTDLFASYANRGGNFNDIIAAPGSSIYSLIPGGLAYKSGTSMATPHVAGVIALYNQYHYDIYGRYVSPSEIKQKLNDTGHVIYDSVSERNYSRVDALELFNNINLDILGTSNVNSLYNNSDTLYFEINLSKPVSNVYVNMTLPNETNEIIHLTNFTPNYNGTYTIPNLHGVYSFVYVIDDLSLINYSESYNFTVLYDYICINFTDCNYSLINYEKVLLNNSLSLNFDEYFIFNNNTEFNCNNHEIYNSNYFEIIGENSSLNNCVFYNKEITFNSTYLFDLNNILFKNYSEIYFNNSILNIGNNSILLNEKVIANSINTTANYKINKTCDGLEIDILRLNKITNSTKDFVDSNYFSTCSNNSIEFNSSLNGSYTYNIFNITVTNTTGGRINTELNYTYLFNLTNNNLINDVFTFNQTNNIQFFNLNSSNYTLIEFNVSKNVSGNHTLNYSLCSTKLNRCLDSNFTIEVLEAPSFNYVEIRPYVVSNNTNVTFNLNVSNYNSIWFIIDLPNGSSYFDSYHEEYNYTTNQIGVHNITFYANDEFGYAVNYYDYFEVLEAPSFNYVEIRPYVVSNNTNVTFNLNVSNYNSIWFNIDLPNGSSYFNSYHEEYNYTTNQIGVHNITFYANDTLGYVVNYLDYFEVLETEESNLTFKDSKGNLTNVTLNLFYRNQKLFSLLLSNSSIDVYDLIYDLEINFSKLKLKLNEVNLTSKQFNLILDELEYEEYLLTTIINNTFEFTGNYTLEFNYSDLDYTNDNYLEFFKCSDWNFTNNTCNEIFEKKNFTLNKVSKTIVYSDNTFSAFSISQGSYCGDGVCDTDETCHNCPADCGSCYVPPGGGTGGSTGGSSGGGSGGGGGGTGGGSAILPREAVYKNISIDIHYYELIETEEYNLFSFDNNYLFYSKYNGKICFNDNCTLIKPFEHIEFTSTEQLDFTFEKIKLDRAQELNETTYEVNYTINELRNDILFYLDEFNNSRENEEKCAFFLGYHISPCVDKESCLFACRSIPLCSGLSNSDIFLNFSKFIYLNLQELNQEIENCYSIINSSEDVNEYEKCVTKIYNISKTIESSPIFGTCPTCLGVCEEANYSYDSLNKIIYFISNYEKQFIFDDFNIIEYNIKSEKLNSLLDKVSEINKTISYSNREILELIYLHNDFNEVDYKEKEKQLNEILSDIELYNEMNCKSDYERFLNLNHFAYELENCLIDLEAHEEIEGCEECGEPNVLFILISCLVLIGFFFLYKKLKL